MQKQKVKVLLYRGGGQGGLNLPLPVPFNPGSRPVFFASIAKYCAILRNFFLFLPLPATLGILTDRAQANL